MVERAAGFLVLTAAFPGTVAARGNVPPKDLKPVADLISPDIFRLRLDQALPDTGSSFF